MSTVRPREEDDDGSVRPSKRTKLDDDETVQASLGFDKYENAPKAEDRQKEDSQPAASS